MTDKDGLSSHNGIGTSWPLSTSQKLNPIAEEGPGRDPLNWSMPPLGKPAAKGRMGQSQAKPPLLAMFLSLCMGVFLSGFLFSSSLPYGGSMWGAQQASTTSILNTKSYDEHVANLLSGLRDLRQEMDRAEQGMAESGDALSNALATQELEIELHHLRGEYVRLLKTTEELRKNLTDMRSQVNPTALAVRDIDESHLRPEGSMSRIVDSKGEAFFCDRSHPDGDFCLIHGDIRIDSKSSTIVMYATKETTPRGTLTVQPYARKWDAELMRTVTPVVADASGPDGCPQKYTPCANMRMVPAVIFAGGGFTNSTYDDLREVFLPLHNTIHQYDSEVVLMVTDNHNWVKQHLDVLRSFTKYPIRLLKDDRDIAGNLLQAECYRHVIVGLRMDLTVPDHSPGRPQVDSPDEKRLSSTLLAYSQVIARRMRLPPSQPIGECLAGASPQKPVLGLLVPNSVSLQRTGRGLANAEEVGRIARQMGFTVQAIGTGNGTYVDLVKFMRGADVLVGMASDELGHLVHLRPKAVVMQIIGYGETGFPGAMAGREYQDLAKLLGLRYLEWVAGLEESSIRREAGERQTPAKVWSERTAAAAAAMYRRQVVTVPEDALRSQLAEAKEHLLVLGRQYAKARGVKDPRTRGSDL